MPPIVTVPINGAALLAIRKAKRLSTQQVADRCEKVHRSYIAKVESGQRPGVSPRVFAEIAAALDVDPRALMAAPHPSEAVA